MRFIETPVFTGQVTALMDETAYACLQTALALRPTQGILVPGGGGIRKLRWAGSGRGKRGGIRLWYYWYPLEDVIYMLAVFPKNRAADLTPTQLSLMARYVKEHLR